MSSFASWSLTSVRRGKQSSHVPSAYIFSLSEVARHRKNKNVTKAFVPTQIQEALINSIH
ncbi:MAG: hypothetical protein RLZZ123_1125 [Pseudomonadota bacterium]|jgi:hypothetical protein